MRPTEAAVFRLVTVLSVLAAPLLLCSAMASAAIYDDFTVFKPGGYDAGKWTVEGAGFTQPGDGCLHYKGTGPATATPRIRVDLLVRRLHDAVR